MPIDIKEDDILDNKIGAEAYIFEQSQKWQQSLQQEACDASE